MKHARTPDPAWLDSQYNNRALVPDHAIHFSRWQAWSADARRAPGVLTDVAYGHGPGETLDLFLPPRRVGAGLAPVMVFIHGGWWRSLDKSDFTFIVPGYRQAGFNVALTNYTLAPEAPIEEIVLQQIRALTWLYRNAERLEFDRDRIVIAGHSAGGHLAAMMLAALWPTHASDLPRDLIKGGVLMSGLYDLAPVCHADFVNVDLKLDDDRALKLSPAQMPQSHPAPFITAVGDLESDEFKRQTALIGTQWAAGFRGDIALQGINHLTICDAFGDPAHPLFKASCTLVESV